MADDIKTKALTNKQKLVRGIIGLIALIASVFFGFEISQQTQDQVTDGIVKVLPDAPKPTP